MNVGGKPYRTIWLNDDGWSVEIIDQTRLPHRFETCTLHDLSDAAHAIRSMQVRGAPLIGVTAAYGLCLALREDSSDSGIDRACESLMATRPTAVNLRWAVEEMRASLRNQPKDKLIDIAYRRAAAMADEDVEICKSIGAHGLKIIQDLAAKKPAGRPVNILTHCNAGWLATVDWGTATAPIYAAHGQGIPAPCLGGRDPAAQPGRLAHRLGAQRPRRAPHRDRRQCRRPSDAAWPGGHVYRRHRPHHRHRRRGQQDRHLPEGTGRQGQRRAVLCRAAVAHHRLALADGVREIPIEQRGGEELSHVTGRTASGEIATVTITPEGSPVANYAFDVTPARLVTGLITERGVAAASREGLAKLFPERARAKPFS